MHSWLFVHKNREGGSSNFTLQMKSASFDILNNTVSRINYTLD